MHPLISSGILAALTCGLHAQIVLTNGTPNPAYKNLWAWYDAANGPNSSATPLPDGTPITRWDDRGSGKRHLTRGDNNATRQPTARNNIGTCGPAVEFNGDDYIWQGAQQIGRLSSARTILLVVDVGVANGGYIFDGSTFSGRTALFTGDTANPGSWLLYWSDNRQSAPNGYQMNGPKVATNRYRFRTVVMDKGVQELYVDTKKVASAKEARIFNLGGIILGSRANTANGLIGHIKEVLVYQENLSAVDRALLWAYFSGRHSFAYGVAYGKGCAGTGKAVPKLTLTGCPAPSKRISLGVTNALGGAPGALLVGTTRTSLPIGPCTVLLAPVIVTVPFVTAGSGAGAGKASLTLTIPASVPAATVTWQGAVLDRGSASGFFSATNGLEMHVF